MTNCMGGHMKTLETERLILRPWKESDYKDLFEYASNSLVGPNAGWKPHKNEEESKEIITMFIENKEVYAIELKSEGKVIGGIGMHKRIPDEELEHLNQREIGSDSNSFASALRAALRQDPDCRGASCSWPRKSP